ncbi:MAG: NAD-dependent deacylase [Planctomycetota bacterium]
MNILVLTGAGISAESGIPTFRDADGLWEGHRFEDVATPEAFARDPATVHRFYNERRKTLQQDSIQPNSAHLALAEFETWAVAAGHSFLLVTQNIDNLHARAGSQNVLHMHGELMKVSCLYSGDTFDWDGDLSVDTPHPDHLDDDSKRGLLRPHVVWFGEMPLGMSKIERAAGQAHLFVSIGTSALVYPAAGIIHWTPAECRRVELNLQTTQGTDAFDQSIQGPASRVVPQFFNGLMNGSETP